MTMKKLSIEYIKIQFEKKNCKLLSDEYKGANYKLDYICPNGHKSYISWANFRTGVNCKTCFDENRRIGIEKIRRCFNEEGYVLLSNVYINNKQKLKYICPNGHKHTVKWNAWIRGVRCPHCIGLHKLNIIFVKKEFEKENYKLLTNMYENCNQKLKYICPNNHKHYISWNKWQQGRRCPKCRQEEYIIKYSGKDSPNWKGGISCEPYCDIWIDKEYKESIKERDGNRCLNPDCWKTSNRLGVHHINYDKKNCEPENLITLCVSCNSRANYNRNYWKELYLEAWRHNNGNC